MTDILDINLPKWPGLFVQGEPVTKEQAAEILIRTDSLYFSCNDKEWARFLCETVGFKVDDWDWGRSYDDSGVGEAIEASLGHIPLHYLDNAQIASCYIGGPQGWCDWDGNIGCNSFNIGKWPSVGDVLEDWTAIATAFPFLDLTCQLFNGESCEVDTSPVVEFRVQGGQAEAREPTLEGSRLVAPNFELLVGHRMHDLSFERGCSSETFAWAVALVLEKVGKP